MRSAKKPRSIITGSCIGYDHTCKKATAISAVPGDSKSNGLNKRVCAINCSCENITAASSDNVIANKPICAESVSSEARRPPTTE